MENICFNIEDRTQFFYENKVGFLKFSFERMMYKKYVARHIQKVCDKHEVTTFLRVRTTDTAEDGSFEFISDLDGDIAIVNLSFDVASYLSLNIMDKSYLLYRLIRDSYGIVLTKLNYEADIVISFMQDLQQLESSFQFNEVVTKFKTDVNRKNKMEIVMSGNIENLRFYFHMVDLKSNKEESILFCDMHSYHFESNADYRRLVMKGQWISENIYSASNYSNEIFHEYNLETKRVNIVIKPANPANKEWLENKYRLYTTTDRQLVENIILQKEW